MESWTKKKLYTIEEELRNMGFKKLGYLKEEPFRSLFIEEWIGFNPTRFARTVCGSFIPKLNTNEWFVQIATIDELLIQKKK